jgi:hypothetical protein
MTAHGNGGVRPQRPAFAARIPFEITGGGHIFLRVRVNGSEPLLFGLDSGAEGTLLNSRRYKSGWTREPLAQVFELIEMRRVVLAHHFE